MIKIQLIEPLAVPGSRHGMVLNDRGEIIGDCHDSTYQGRGFACHTKMWAGFVDVKDVEFVGGKAE